MNTDTPDKSSLIDRLQSLPRAGRWGVYGLIIILGLWIYTEPVLGLAAKWNAEADRAQEALNRTRDPIAARRPVDNVRDTIGMLGSVEVPTGESSTSEQLKTVVNEILKRYPVSKDSLLTQAPSKLKQDTLRAVVRSGQQAQKITGQLDFDAGDQDAARIIAELEASEAIESIRSVRLTKLGQNRVSARLTLEAWVISSTNPAATGGRR